jgi:EAL domain-containing protein (putative c-di-GMP-specific phosphodiesterase class I)
MTLDDLLDRRNLKPRYEPIFDLSTGEPVGAEGLARWPSMGIMPARAFQWATEQGRLGELDEACRDAVIDDALGSGLMLRRHLFVNLEPSVIGPATVDRLVRRVEDRAGLVVEITERGLLQRPAELLRAVHRLRESGCGIALDDVGAVPESLAFLPFIAPDVIKLDMSLVQERPNRGHAAIADGVASYVERNGPAVIAEGIETGAQLRRALALGATLGQGWYLSRSGSGTTVAPSLGRGERRRLVGAVPAMRVDTT